MLQQGFQTLPFSGVGAAWENNAMEKSESYGQIAAISRDLARSVALRGMPLAGTTLPAHGYLPRVVSLRLALNRPLFGHFHYLILPQSVNQPGHGIHYDGFGRDRGDAVSPRSSSLDSLADMWMGPSREDETGEPVHPVGEVPSTHARKNVRGRCVRLHPVRFTEC